MHDSATLAGPVGRRRVISGLGAGHFSGTAAWVESAGGQKTQYPWACAPLTILAEDEHIWGRKLSPMPTTAAPEAEPIQVLSTEERLAAGQKIVKRNTYIAAGVSAVPVFAPMLDLAAIGGVQVLMIKQLSDLYRVPFKENVARNLVAALVGTLSYRVLAAGVVGSIFKVLPGFGAVIGGLLALPAVSGAVTYALGKVFVKHFEEGGTLLDLDVNKVRDFFASQYQVGRKVAAEPAPAAS